MGLEIRFTTGDITPAEIDVLLLLLHRLDDRNVKSDDVMSKLKSMASDAVPVTHESITITAPAPVESSVSVPLVPTPPAPVAPVIAASPVASTETATVDQTASPSDPNERDSDGVVWDARIHSGNHKKAASGKWIRRKGVSEQVFQHVLAELKSGAPMVTQVAPPAPVATQLDPAAVFAAPAAPAPVAPAAPVAPPSNVVPMPVAAPVAPPAAPVSGGVDFPTIMGKISEMTAAGKKPMELLAQIGIANATALIGSQPERDRAMTHLLAN